MVQAPSDGKRGWKFAAPDEYGGDSGALNNLDPKNLLGYVQATDRLTAADALRLAKKSVWKYYQLTDIDVSDWLAHAGVRIKVPGFGQVLRKQQIILEDSQVDQVTPQPADNRATDDLGRPLIINFYNGYSRDKPAAVYGSVCQDWIDGSYFFRQNQNTPAGSQVLIGFEVDPVWQLVKFSAPVVFYSAGEWFEPRPLVLQTACTVRDPETNRPVCYVASRRFADTGTNFATTFYPDIQLNVTATYKGDGFGIAVFIDKVSILEADAVLRAGFYLDAETLKFPPAGAETKRYNGIKTIGPDGAIQQVTWEVGANGPFTTASWNCEHSIYVPPFPARRRVQFLSPANQRLMDDATSPPRRDATGEGKQ